MVDPSVAVTALLRKPEAVALSSACKLAGISLTDWCRHVVFGEVAAPSSPPEDVLAADALVRLGGLTLILRDRLVKADEDLPVHHLLADMASVLIDAEHVLARPYALSVLPMAGISAGSGPRTTQVRVRCSTGERALVEQAADKLMVSVGAWMGAAITGGGLPGPVRPHTDPAAGPRWDDVIRVVTTWVQCANTDEVKAAIQQQAEHLIAAIRKAARVEMVAVQQPICEGRNTGVVL